MSEVLEAPTRPAFANYVGGEWLPAKDTYEKRGPWRPVRGDRRVPGIWRGGGRRRGSCRRGGGARLGVGFRRRSAVRR